MFKEITERNKKEEKKGERKYRGSLIQALCKELTERNNKERKNIRDKGSMEGI